MKTIHMDGVFHEICKTVWNCSDLSAAGGGVGLRQCDVAAAEPGRQAHPAARGGKF